MGCSPSSGKIACWRGLYTIVVDSKSGFVIFYINLLFCQLLVNFHFVHTPPNPRQEPKQRSRIEPINFSTAIFLGSSLLKVLRLARRK